MDKKNKTEFIISDELEHEIAIKMLVMGMCDQMIPAIEARKVAEAHHQAQTQKYLLLTHQIIGFGIALEKLGYKLVKEGR